MSLSRVTLLTDFGTRDGYAAAMRGVIAAIAPDVLVEDASHDIPPGDVFCAAWTLARYWNLFPPGTKHVVVVDPGVGSSRRAVVVEADGRQLVAPDNGVLTNVLLEAQRYRAFEIANSAMLRHPIAPTFHGRDVLAPVAAHLANGMSIELVGPPINDLVTLETPVPRRDGDVIHGRVLMSDRFGNLITNIPGAWVPAHARIEIGGIPIGPLRTTYTDALPGAPLALVGSLDLLEISIRDGSAAETLSMGKGSIVRIVQ